MGITLPNNNDSTYYAGTGDHGAYQFLTLKDIVETFLATYTAAGKKKAKETAKKKGMKVVKQSKKKGY